MDLKLITLKKEIKQEEPVDYFLISTLSEGELNVDYTSSQSLTESSIELRVKEEEEEEDLKSVDVEDDESHDPLACASEKSETSEYEPDSAYEDNEDGNHDTDDDFVYKKNRKSTNKVKQTNGSSKYPITILEYEEIKGPPYTCSVCSLTFPLKKSLVAHQSIHQGKKFRCDLCKKVFKTRTHIHEHMKIHLEPQFSCPICSKKFAVKKSFMIHQFIHEEKKFQCDICSKLFRQKGHVMEHMKVV